VDKRLDAIGTDEAKALRGKAAIANARLAYQAYEEVFAAALAGARGRRRPPQRPLWASTGSRTRPTPTPCTSPSWWRRHGEHHAEKTIGRVADHGESRRHGPRPYAEAAPCSTGWRRSASPTTRHRGLEREGVEKFEKSWSELLATSRRARPRASADSAAEAGQ
jgi:transaldolase